MNYTLFEESILLQALLKEEGLIQSGGASKAFLATHAVYVNNHPETRRRRKLTIGDCISIPEIDFIRILVGASPEEQRQYNQEKAEKERMKKQMKSFSKKKSSTHQPRKKRTTPFFK